MTTAFSPTGSPAGSPSGPAGSIAGGLRRAEAWLDARGRPAWIAATVAGFILFWPVGLALLAYMIWSKRMFGRSCAHRTHRRDRSREMAHEFARRAGFRSSGNTAFDAYKAETLRRLQDEQEAFEAFLDRLRAAKDQQEFDAFMEDRARQNAAREARADSRDGWRDAGGGAPQTPPAPPPGNPAAGY